MRMLDLYTIKASVSAGSVTSGLQAQLWLTSSPHFIKLQQNKYQTKTV